jgi:hypothetical protein
MINIPRDDLDELTVVLDNVRIIEGSFDLIIGLPTIRRYDLTRQLRALFGPRPSTDKIVADHMSALQGTDSWLSALTTKEKAKSINDSDIPTQLRVEFAKQELIESLEDDGEIPEWKESITDLIESNFATRSSDGKEEETSGNPRPTQSQEETSGYPSLTQSQGAS